MRISKSYVAFVLLIILAACVAKPKAEPAPVEEPVKETIEHQKVEMPEIEIEVETEEDLEIYHIPAREPEFGFDFDYICRVVAAESRGEPFEGQIAVARCIWNTSIKKGISMEEVVQMPNRYADPVAPELVTESLREACMYAFLGMQLPTEEPIEYFYSIANGGYSKWHETALEHVITIGNHKFFKEVE